MTKKETRELKEISMQCALQYRKEIRELEARVNADRLYISLPSEDAIMDEPRRHILALKRTRDMLANHLNDFNEFKKQLDI
jgi:hypothetical protein